MSNSAALGPSTLSDLVKRAEALGVNAMSAASRLEKLAESLGGAVPAEQPIGATPPPDLPVVDLLHGHAGFLEDLLARVTAAVARLEARIG
ncbi:hypothetical protein [Methylobacterium sp. JK268]